MAIPYDAINIEDSYFCQVYIPLRMARTLGEHPEAKSGRDSVLALDLENQNGG
jgi:hypothetical protein